MCATMCVFICLTSVLVAIAISTYHTSLINVARTFYMMYMCVVYFILFVVFKGENIFNIICRVVCVFKNTLLLAILWNVFLVY